MSKKPTTPPGVMKLDAIGLARPEGFKDFPGAVSVMAADKTLRVMDRFDWRTSPRTFMAVWEAEQHQLAFRKTHADAVVEQRYRVEDKTIMELTATYDDDRASHRVVYQARNR